MLHMRFYIYHMIHIFIIKRQTNIILLFYFTFGILHFQLRKELNFSRSCKHIELSVFQYDSFIIQHSKFLWNATYFIGRECLTNSGEIFRNHKSNLS